MYIMVGILFAVIDLTFRYEGSIVADFYGSCWLSFVSSLELYKFVIDINEEK